MKEADKLACLVLSLLFQFHSTVRAHFGAVQMSKAHRKTQPNVRIKNRRLLFYLNVVKMEAVYRTLPYLP